MWRLLWAWLLHVVRLAFCAHHLQAGMVMPGIAGDSGVPGVYLKAAF
jgi:hypothetical protein